MLKSTLIWIGIISVAMVIIVTGHAIILTSVVLAPLVCPLYWLYEAIIYKKWEPGNE